MTKKNYFFRETELRRSIFFKDFTNGIMSSGIIVSGIFFARHQLLRMEQLAIGSSSHFVDDGRLQIHKNGSRNMFTSSSLGEKCAERIVSYKKRENKRKQNN